MIPLPLAAKRLGVSILLAAIAASVADAAPPPAPAAAPSTVETLDGRFRDFSTQFYAALVRHDNAPKARAFDALVERIERHRAQGQPVAAVAAVIDNLALVESHIDANPIVGITALLFETNEWNTGSRLYHRLREQGDRSLAAAVSLAVAKHHFDRRHWNETINIVAALRSDLSAEDYHHALLMHGISLQQLRKHREALQPYAKVPSSSRYYTAARLNMAVANIRQDWWTDAHALINDLLADPRRAHGDELADRLYTVLGYSLLHQQYYRNSREAFRNVGVDSRYANRALLGIALTAARQEDYVGALNAVRILKNSPLRDLPADEAVLLLPHLHERLGQHATASAGYAEAANYYQNRVLQLQAAAPADPEAVTRLLITAGSDTITLNGEILDFGERLPKSAFDNLRMLAQFQPHVRRLGDAALTRDFDSLNADYGRLLHQTARDLLAEKSDHIDHYMSQSRYGLARMQDHDTAASK